jgi:hypothetical protein
MLVLYAEDNDAERHLAQLAAAEAGLDCEIRFVGEGRSFWTISAGRAIMLARGLSDPTFS